MKRVIGLASMVTFVAATSASAGCKEIASAIEAAEKDLGAIQVDIAFAGGNVPAETLLRLRMANQLAAINADIALADRLKCPPRSDPIDGLGDAYVTAASRCKAARGEDGQKACDRRTWQRGSPDR